MTNSNWTLTDWIELGRLGAEKTAAFWASLGPQLAGNTRLDDTAKAFEHFAETIQPAFAGGQADDLSAALATYLENLLERDAHEGLEPWSGFLRELESDGATGLFLSSAFKPVADLQASLLDMPALGPGREWLEAGESIVRASLALQEAARGMAGHQREITRRALTAFVRFLRTPADRGIDSVRELFEHWLRIADDAYREVALEQDFSRDLGDWVSARGDLQNAWRTMSERVGEALGLPTAGDLAALGARQRDLQAEVSRLREAIERIRPEAQSAEAPVDVAPVDVAPAAPSKPRPRAQPPRPAKPSKARRKKPAKAKRAPAQVRPKPTANEFDISQITDAPD